MVKRILAAVLCIAVISSAVPVLQIGSGAEEAFVLPSAGLNYDRYPALREVYKDYFLVGTLDIFTGELRNNFMAYTYNAVTHQNNMKPSLTQNNKGTFTFNSAHSSIVAARALIPDVQIIGHTLTWHSQSPNWMWDAPDFDRDTALENMNAHIDAVLGEFGGELQAIDVVNEAIGTVSWDTPGDWRSALDKGEGWFLALGWEWVELAFLRAAEVVDKNGWDCKLYYNDFGLEGDKAFAVFSMVRDINNRYEGHRPNGKPLIEGIGSQGHFNSSTRPSAVEEAVRLFARLPGVSISFTELDVEFLNTGTLTREQEIAQAQIYAQLFQIFKNYAAGSANTTDNPKIIERVTFWGADDGASWKSSSLPLLFNAPADGQITAKEALLGVLFPDEYLELHPPPENDEDRMKLMIPGVYVYSLNRGDIWAGANIILGDNADEWPWSAAYYEEDGEIIDGEVAFRPEKDETYRLSFSYTALGTTGVRVRWINDNTNGGYTATDGQVVNTPPFNTGLRANDVATMVPALFNNGMVNAGTYTVVTEIKMDGSLPADDLVGNLAIRGFQGGNAFDINWIKMERVSDGEVMFLWDPLNPPDEQLTVDGEPEEEAHEPEEETHEPEEQPSLPVSQEPDDEGSNTFIIILLTICTLSTIGAVIFVVLRKKRK
ncbi:MAG: endo-1,4-beta-xylanase [Oscillospiraceae bacterium]|nr:endo-1,4-beta-xylanase [Oscillospiraceae bacterium]